MTPEVKERLYRELMNILLLLEDGNLGRGRNELEDLINKLQYDKL
jgi:hypothetical protein